MAGLADGTSDYGEIAGVLKFGPRTFYHLPGFFSFTRHRNMMKSPHCLKPGLDYKPDCRSRKRERATVRGAREVPSSGLGTLYTLSHSVPTGADPHKASTTVTPRRQPTPARQTRKRRRAHASSVCKAGITPRTAQGCVRGWAKENILNNPSHYQVHRDAQ